MRVLVAVLMLAWCGVPALAQTHHALVIGIDAYAEIAPLQKAVNDAAAVADALAGIGYAVTLVATPEQTTTDALIVAIARFVDQIAPGDVAVVFFAGHGVEIDGRNYLIPIDVPEISPAQDGADRLLQSRAISADQLLADLRAQRPQAVILILDACRDNPFPRPGDRSLGATRGLSRIEVSTDVFVLYSAGIGQTALDRLGNDDPDPNSVFTRSLLPLLAEPGLHPADIARRLRGDVQALAATVNHQQRPAYYDELAPDFTLAVAPAPQEADPTEDPQPAAVEAASTADSAVAAMVEPAEPALPLAAEAPDGAAACRAGDVAACIALLSRRGDWTDSAADDVVAAVMQSAFGPANAAAVLARALDAGIDRPLALALQRRLAETGDYSGAIDGIAGPGTRAALAAWAQPDPDPLTEAVQGPASDQPSVPAVTAQDWLAATVTRLADPPLRDGAAMRYICAGMTSEGERLVADQYANWSGDLSLLSFSRILGGGGTVLIADVPGRPPITDGNWCPIANGGFGARLATIAQHQTDPGLPGLVSEDWRSFPVVSVWDLATGAHIASHQTAILTETLGEVGFHPDAVGIELDPNGLAFVTWGQVSYDPPVHQVELWRVGEIQPRATWEAPGGLIAYNIHEVAFSPDGLWLASVEGPEIVIRSSLDGSLRTRWAHPGDWFYSYSYIVWTPDGANVGWVNGASELADGPARQVAFWTASDGALIDVFELEHSEAAEGNSNSATVSPDGRWLVVNNYETGAHVWDLDGPALVGHIPPDEENPVSRMQPVAGDVVLGLEFGFEGRLGRIAVHDLNSGQRVGFLSQPPEVSVRDYIRILQPTADGQGLYGFSFGQVFRWDLPG